MEVKMKYEKHRKLYITKKENELRTNLNRLEKVLLSPTVRHYGFNNELYVDGCSCPECGCVVDAFSPLGVAGGMGALIGFSPLK